MPTPINSPSNHPVGDTPVRYQQFQRVICICQHSSPIPGKHLAKTLVGMQRDGKGTGKPTAAMGKVLDMVPVCHGINHPSFSRCPPADKPLRGK